MSIPAHLTGKRAELELVSRQNTQSVYFGNKTVLSRVLAKYKMLLDTEDFAIAPHLCLEGFWEAWITLAISRVVTAGWYCVDVGANHGYYSLIMADAVGPTGRVLAIEPNPRLVELLQFNLMLNGFTWSNVLAKAACDVDRKRLTLAIPRHLSGGASVMRGACSSDDVVEVETVTLDEVTKDWPRVDLVKIDAEGAEYAIWCGMHRVLERNPQIAIVMEVECSRYADPSSFLREIQRFGFRLRYINYDGQIESVTEEELLKNRGAEYYMLFLKRD